MDGDAGRKSSDRVSPFVSTQLEKSLCDPKGFNQHDAEISTLSPYSYRSFWWSKETEARWAALSDRPVMRDLQPQSNRLTGYKGDDFSGRSESSYALRHLPEKALNARCHCRSPLAVKDSTLIRRVWLSDIVG